MASLHIEIIEKFNFTKQNKCLNDIRSFERTYAPLRSLAAIPLISSPSSPICLLRPLPHLVRCLLYQGLSLDLLPN